MRFSGGAGKPSVEELAKMRRDYGEKSLDESQIGGGPFALFKDWLDEAVEARVTEPNAMCLSTIGADNRPKSRYVLLKGFSVEEGFVWFTNYDSRKGQELAQNPYAALTFWWGDLERSVRIEGKVSKVSAEESDEYFQKRPRGAEIGAWSSQQSQPIGSQTDLQNQYKLMSEKFENHKVIPRPESWGGYRLVPDYIEFWKGRSSRLHDRIAFTYKPDGVWSHQRLQP